MNREEAKAELKTREPDFLTQAKKRVNGSVTYICPNCQNGTGKDGDGIALDPKAKNGKRWKCFACGINEDIIGLWELHTGISNKAEAFKELYEYYNINITVDSSRQKPQEAVWQKRKQAKNEQYTDTAIHTNTYTLSTEQEQLDFTDFFLQAHNNIEATDYWKQRGLSRDIVDRFRLGYVAEWKLPLEAYLRGGERAYKQRKATN